MAHHAVEQRLLAEEVDRGPETVRGDLWRVWAEAGPEDAAVVVPDATLDRALQVTSVGHLHGLGLHVHAAWWCGLLAFPFRALGGHSGGDPVAFGLGPLGLTVPLVLAASLFGSLGGFTLPLLLRRDRS